MAWLWNRVAGVYSDHSLSSNIRREALADALFMRFIRAEPGFGRGKGQSHTITRILQLPLGAKVKETERLPTGRPAVSTKAVTVSPWGFKIEITEFEQHLTHFDITNQFQRMLRDQMNLTFDKMVADAMKLTPIKYIPTSVVAGVFDTDGTPSTQATANMTVAHLREIFDYLQGTLKAPKYRGGRYVGILSTKGARGIKNDPEYREWQAPTTAEPFITGRLKDVEGFALFETNHYDALSNGIGLNSLLGECIFFGDDLAYLVETQTPELRAGLPDDLGRFRDVGWVGEIDAGLVWDTAAQARGIHVSSS